MDQWSISSLEYQQSEVHFIALQPDNGLITGDKARPFLLKSGLPPQILAQIWALADMNQDGKMDKMEFAVAMKLVRNALAGMPLPSILPETMKRVAPSAPPPMMQPQLPLYGSMQYSAPPLPPRAPSVPATPTFELGTKELGNWAIPHHLKLKYSQHFNQVDRNRVGSLTGTQARGVLGESGLPTNLLAQIWQLSDANKDGCLSIEEFCVAMYFIEMVKSGFSLPPTLPPELATFCHRSKTASPSVETNGPPPQKSPSLKTFEDKRRDNLDKGEAELERRRQILREEEERRKAEIDRREREEFERRERERLEIERRREAERELERQREREREEARAAEEARLQAEREEARKKLEQERIKELENIRIKDLEGLLQAEREKTTQIQQRHNTMKFQLQALEEKSQQLNKEITDSRDDIIAITAEIEKMREKRDQKRARIEELTSQSQQLTVQRQRLSHEHLQMQSDSQQTLSRTHEIENLRRQIAELNEQAETATQEMENIKQRLTNQEKLVNEKKPEADAAGEKLQKIMIEYNELALNFRTRQDELRMKAAPQANSTPKQMSPQQAPEQPLYEVPPEANDTKSSAFGFADFTANFEAAFSSSRQNSVAEEQPPKQSQPPTPTSAASTTASVSATTAKYRALYEFVARSDDELSIQPGDVVLVFEGHASEPGWLAGQIKDKVGWFPAAFAEPLSAKKPAATTGGITTSPSTEPLESIKEEPSEREFAAEFPNGTASHPHNEAIHAATSNGTSGTTVTPSGALYDAPPGPDSFVGKSSPEKPSTPATTPTGGTAIGTATALYQWKARNDTELSFSKGDRIEILEKGEMRWRGRLEKAPASSGWFPKSYVKMEETQPKLSQQKSTESHKSDKPQSAVSASASVSSIKNSQAASPTAGGEWYVALYQFDAVETTDLSLRPGDRILVTETKDEWWKGTIGDRSGIFPANYVQKTDAAGHVAAKEHVGRAIAAYEATAPNQISLRMGDLVRIRSTSPGGWWEGEVERDGAKLMGWFPGNYVQVVDAPSAQGTNGINGGPGASSPTSSGGQLAEAAFDYEAQHADELSFKQGDIIEVVDRTDAQWWKGRKQGAAGDPMLFPANFVQLRVVSWCADGGASVSLPTSAAQPVVQGAHNSKLYQQTKELIDTEQRFCSDLSMVKSMFKANMTSVVGEDEVSKIFLNWDQLIKVSKRICTDLGKHPPGDVFCRRIDSLEAFVYFCEHQQSAIDALGNLERSNAKFKRMYNACCQQEQARGVSLSYYLLLPMGRVTRYPLIFEKMIKYSSPADPQYEILQNAYQLLKALCARVNHALAEAGNKEMLYWSQHNIRTDALKPVVLEFTSQTRLVGPRTFLHAGVLFKVKTNKLLVALLYNDFLLLTTPNDAIEEPDSFKVTKQLDLKLTLYKTPLMLDKLSMVPNTEENVIALKETDLIWLLRAPNRNSKTLWTTQLQKALDQYDVAVQMRNAQKTNEPKRAEIGRLLLEIISLGHFNAHSVHERRLLCQLRIGNNALVRNMDVNLARERNLLSTQLPIFATNEVFHLSMFIPTKFRPDVKIGEADVSIQELVNASAAHHGPIIKVVRLQGGELPGQSATAELKFVVQMFDT